MTFLCCDVTIKNSSYSINESSSSSYNSCATRFSLSILSCFHSVCVCVCCFASAFLSTFLPAALPGKGGPPPHQPTRYL